ncbi:hypothetical protein LJC68_07465 [Bacteroidales bacterium OttesenSCG-928-B11]|nr:hypothetical protein [Bacteroidales bacterium OttesenSCG-928-C03]MDL2312698.1 hypothetical protein [Bacteroidales bacterium OttesenSCG-928-B11]
MKHTTLLIIPFLLYACGNNPTQESHFEQEAVAERYIEIEEEASPEVLDAAVIFINYVKAGKEVLSEHIAYPLNRKYPVPPIANKEEFLRRYDEVFDEALLKMIIESDPAIDWNEMGWRGIMLNNGDVWIDEDGKLTAINYQSEIETQKKKEVIKADRENLHESLRKFETPIHLIETDSYRIRIDDLGNEHYRYASWKISSSMEDEPELVIANGIYKVEGSIGNRAYTFANGNHVYQCWIWAFDDKESATLLIYKDAKIDENGMIDGTEIVSQAGKLKYY